MSVCRKQRMRVSEVHIGRTGGPEGGPEGGKNGGKGGTEGGVGGSEAVSQGRCCLKISMPPPEQSKVMTFSRSGVG
jgi:hypothetical protein